MSLHDKLEVVDVDRVRGQIPSVLAHRQWLTPRGRVSGCNRAQTACKSGSKCLVPQVSDTYNHNHYILYEKRNQGNIGY